MTIGEKTRKSLKEPFSAAKSLLKLTQGEMIKILRQKNELSQFQLAQTTGLNQSTISELENNRIKLDIKRAKILATALKVHPAILVFPDWNKESVA